MEMEVFQLTCPPPSVNNALMSHGVAGSVNLCKHCVNPWFYSYIHPCALLHMAHSYHMLCHFVWPILYLFFYLSVVFTYLGLCKTQVICNNTKKKYKSGILVNIFTHSTSSKKLRMDELPVALIFITVGKEPTL